MTFSGVLALAIVLAAGAPAPAAARAAAASATIAAAPAVVAQPTVAPEIAPRPGESVGSAVDRVEADAHEQPHGASDGKVDIITPHITDSHELELPYWKAPFYKPVHLPRWEPVMIGGFAVDLSPTKHVVFLLLAAVLTTLMMVGAARAHTRQHGEHGRPKGFASGLEAMVLYLREEVVMQNIPHGGAKYVPFILTLFFLILFANLLGLIPYGSTATGNISVTATLAIITFIVVEIAGMRALGAGYLKTIIYWPDDMPIAIKLPMTLIMTPIEIVGKLTKPFALAIRLFANMTAGHIVVLALIGLIFSFASLASAAPLLMAVAIMMLELFVAFLQAFIFALLSSVFIGQIVEAH
ncbi:MAG: F0F1 ATP synthase subunit A [Gemmatimonadaceae bacterium]